MIKKFYASIQKRLIESKSAFSLAESMFAIVIGGLILGMIMILNVGVNRNMIIGVAMTDINADGRLAMERIVQDLRWASDIETSRTIDSVSYITADDELVFEIPSINTSGNIIGSTYDYVVYALDSTDATKMRQVVDANASSSRTDRNQIIAGNISSVVFSSSGTGLGSVGSLAAVESVEVSITVSDTPLTGRTVSETITSKVNLRNK